MALAVTDPCSGQSTQALITGRITDRHTGRSIQGATHVAVAYENASINVSGSGEADENGLYALPLLPPGTYSLTATAGNDYQPLRYESIVVPVAAVLDIDFALRPIADIFDQDLFGGSAGGYILNFYGPDLDTSRAVLVEPLRIQEGRLESTVSDVIDPAQIENLPFTGRNVYAAILLQPGVNADPAATRGLGFSVNGQRPSSSNFLLDGVQVDNYLITGPLISLPPEAIQEYRLSTNNFSAEFGGTSGYLVNAVTRAGSTAWRGQIYLEFMNEALNGNGFQENLSGFRRPKLREWQPGVTIGGPVWRKLISASGAFEYLDVGASLDPQTFDLPTAATLSEPAVSEGRKLLLQYPAVVQPAGPADTAAAVTLSPPASLSQYLALARADAISPGQRHRFFFRAAVSRFTRPDFYWTPYPAFVSGFGQSYLNVAAAASDDIGKRGVNEFRVAFNRDLLDVTDNNHNLPELQSNASVYLPGSQSPYAFRYLGHTWQALDNVTLALHSHLLKLGGSGLFRNLGGYWNNGADGTFSFETFSDFLNDAPLSYTVSAARSLNPGAPVQTPDYQRSYDYRQYSLFAQDVWKIGSRFTVNYGLRYEYSGAPENTGAQKDDLIALGPGNNLGAALTGASFVAPASGSQTLFSVRPNTWAPRLGFSWVPSKKFPFVVRGSYGIFYDGLFDNLWLTLQTNSIVTVSSSLLTAPVPYPVPGTAFQTVSGFSPVFPPIQPIVFQPDLRSGMVQSAFIGFQTSAGSAVTIEVNGLASRGRGLLTTDYVNRDESVPAVLGINSEGEFNPLLGQLSYRGNQGFSNYSAATALVKFHFARIVGQAAYTWSHSIDNQSDPIAGEYSFEFASTSAGGAYADRASFTSQFNSNADIGNSDFDQRQSLVFYFLSALPSPRSRKWYSSLLKDWQVSGLGAIRSGIPFSAYAGVSSGPQLIQNRANLDNPTEVFVHIPIPGGVQLLNPAAFSEPAVGQLGTSGRNAFSGPGTITSNISLSRSFTLPRLPERVRLVFRADAYNFLNHANLYVDQNNPFLGNSQFGTAQFGTTGFQTNIPVQVPLTETARQIQLSVRLYF
jgi:hypothetical protein